MIETRRSLIARFVVFYTLLTIATASAFSVMIFRNQLELIAENSALQAELIGGRLFAELNGMTDTARFSDPAFVIDLAGRVGLAERFTLAVYDENGTPRAAYLDGQAVFAAQPDEETEALILAALTGMTFAQSRYVVDLDVGDRRIDLYVPAQTSNGERFVVTAVLRLRGPLEALRRLYRQVVAIAAMTILLNGAFGAYFGLRVFAPLLRLRAAIEEISTGSLGTRVAADSADELGQMGRAVNRMAESLERMHLEARWANPLTGLPGNPAIEHELTTRLEAGDRFAVAYIDLDNFKAFNDRYGYARGDEAILFTSECIDRARRALVPDSFVGHEGGDDFVIVCRPEEWQVVADDVIRQFDEGVPALYDEQDRRAGRIVAVDREGAERVFPIVSLSIAVVSTDLRRFTNPGEVAASVAELKKLAKQRPGSNYVVERRR